MKKFLPAAIALSFILAIGIFAWVFTPLGGAVAGLFGEKVDPSQFVVKMDNIELSMPEPPMMADGEFLISLKSVGEAMGHTVAVDKDKAYVKVDDKIYELTKGSKVAAVNGATEELDAAPVAIENDFYVSTGFVSKAFGIEVSVSRSQKEIVLEREFETLVPFRRALSILKEGTVAKVTDVETGISYMVRRTVGGFDTLADVEPMTLEDTQKMYETYGDALHTTKRAVIVEVDGIEMAASICAFAHSGREDAPFGVMVDNRSGGTGRGINLDSIRDNGIEGVVDIYFYNSLVPGLNRTDEMHQNMVLKAARYQKEKG